ncbi:ARI5A protein, partial [Serilophus lunatus]|nr:ARI5A protein [Serilophus lunatus]
MSPLAKKKLLAQVSEAESLRCPGGRWPRSDPGPAQRSPEASGAQEAAGNEAGPTSSTSPGRMDPHGCQEGGPAPTVFTGTFHAYGTEGLRAGGAHPLWGCFSNLQELLEQPPAFPGPERPQEPRGRAWGSWGPAVSAWVPPGAGMAPRAGQKEEEEDEEEDEEEEDEEDEEPFGPSAKLRAVDPEGRDLAPSCHQGLPKPKAVVATPAFAALHFPAGFGNPMEHPKTQGVPLAPNPFVIPAFPSPLVVGSTPPSELCRPLPAGPGHFSASYGNSLRHRLYPWHGHHPYGSPAFHRHTEL